LPQNASIPLQRFFPVLSWTRREENGRKEVEEREGNEIRKKLIKREGERGKDWGKRGRFSDPPP